MQKQSSTYLPIYHRPQNKFKFYKEEDFSTKSGIKAILKVAHYTDKNGKDSTMIAQVKWL